jgi:hypothetical protein
MLTANTGKVNSKESDNADLRSAHQCAESEDYTQGGKTGKEEIPIPVILT